MDKADLGFAFGLPPEEAIRYFEGLGYSIKNDWSGTWQRAQAQAFSVANIYRQDVTAELYESLQAALKNGQSFATWQQQVQQRFDARSWAHQDGQVVDKATGEVLAKRLTPARLQTVYRTNMQSAMMAGRWSQLYDNKDARPYLQYVAVMDMKTRASHAALHGSVYAIDDPFWGSFYPPNGFNCRCTVMALGERDIKRKDLVVQSSGDKIEDVQLITNKQGKTVDSKAITLPSGQRFTADAGFAGNVGQQHLAKLGQLQLQRAVELPPRLASMAVGESLKNPQVLKAVTAQMTEFAEAVFSSKQARGKMMHVGALPLKVLDELAKRQVLPQSAVISITDDRLLHAIRDHKQMPLPQDFWGRLPEHLLQPDAVLLDRNKGNGAVIMVFKQAKSKNKLVLTVDYKIGTRDLRGKKTTVVSNVINTGVELTEESQVIGLRSYETLFWEL